MSAAYELGHLGVSANVIYPPVTDTGWITGYARQLVKNGTKLIHIAIPDGVAQVITYLVSEEARPDTANAIHLRLHHHDSI